MKKIIAIAFFVFAGLGVTMAGAEEPPKGEIKGSAFIHTEASSVAVIQSASVALPAKLTGSTVFVGPWSAMPKLAEARVPVVVFLHGSSGLGLKAIGEWQAWLAELGVASVAPNSLALADRITYSSPIDKITYERIHALRASEIDMALSALRAVPWADPAKLVLAGTSEGATAVARYGKAAFAARMIFSWSCEDNYFVDAHRTFVDVEQPVLNVISSVDPFFSPSNAWLGNSSARGNCAAAFAQSKKATIVLIPGAPHTLINLPQARSAVRAFLDDNGLK